MVEPRGVAVQLPESQPSPLRVTFVFANDVHPAWREAYDLTGNTFCRFPAGIPPIAGQETATRVVVLTSPNEPEPWFDPKTSRHTGVFALEGYRRLGGGGDKTVVPV